MDNFEQSQRMCEHHEQVEPCGECAKLVEELSHEAEREAAREMLTASRASWGVKQPAGSRVNPIVVDEEDEWDEGSPTYQAEEHHDAWVAGEPDLYGYFKPFGLPPANVIAICRTHANHLSAVVGAKKKRGPYGKRSRANELREGPNVARKIDIDLVEGE